MEYFKFPKKSYYLTQGFGKGSYSHQNRKALDVSASGNGYKEIYAPFTGYVAKKYVAQGNAYTCWLVSDEKVMCANGKSYYAVAMFTHPKEISNLKIGQKFKQGDLLMNDGTTGGATGPHLDLEIAVYDNKKDIVIDWKNVGNAYGLINAKNPCEYMVLDNNCKVKNDYYKDQSKYYKFITKNEVKIVEEYTPGLYETLDNMRIRIGAGFNYRQKRIKELTKDGQKHATSSHPDSLAYYKKGTKFDVLEIIKNSKNEIWARGHSGYVNIIANKYINCKKIN